MLNEHPEGLIEYAQASQVLLNSAKKLRNEGKMSPEIYTDIIESSFRSMLLFLAGDVDEALKMNESTATLCRIAATDYTLERLQ